MNVLLQEQFLKAVNESLDKCINEDWTHFEFTSGANSYIAKTEKEKNRILKKYARFNPYEESPGFWVIDDKSRWNSDLFAPNESLKESFDGRVEELKKRFYEIEDKIQQLVKRYSALQKRYHGDTTASNIVEARIESYEYDQQLIIEELEKLLNKPFKEIKRNLMSMSESLLKESMEEIDRKYFTSLNKEEDGHYYILKDGNYVKDFYADSDEEAIKKFRDGLDESLTEARWNYTLKCGNALRTAIDNGDAEEVINQLWNGYKELLKADIIDDMDYENYTEDLTDSEYWDEDELEDNIDWALDNFYDLCDNTRVWIPLNEHFVTTPEYNGACADIYKQMVDGKISKEEAEEGFRQMDTLLDESHPVTESLWDLVKGYLEEGLTESMWEPADKQELERLRQDIKKTKSKLLSQIKRKHGVWENFGQKELRALNDKYAKLHFTPEYNALIDEFRNWCDEQY